MNRNDSIFRKDSGIRFLIYHRIYHRIYPNSMVNGAFLRWSSGYGQLLLGGLDGLPVGWKGLGEELGDVLGKTPGVKRKVDET